nr:hypothetical protein [Mycoplasmopsis bovis]
MIKIYQILNVSSVKDSFGLCKSKLKKNEQKKNNQSSMMEHISSRREANLNQ